MFCQDIQAQFPNAVLFNTATNSTGTGTLSSLANDLNWTAAMTNSLGTYTPAVVVGVASGWASSPFSNASWITYPHTCSLTPADHSCNALNIDEFYKLTFNLPAQACGQSVATPSSYCLSLDFMADNCVTEIFVNGISSYVTSVTTPSAHGGFNLSNMVTVSLCNNWQAGTNTIIVHVVSGAYSTGGLTGFLAQANQTVNTTIGIPVSATSTQSNALCFGGTGSATIIASGGTAPYTYSWLPAGGTGSVATGLSVGTYSCIVTSSNLCSFTRTLTITQPPALNLNIGVSSPTACVGDNITLTATNSGGSPGYTYTWTAGPANPAYIISAIAGSHVYTVSSKDINNCLVSNTVSLSFISNPALNTSNVTICNGAIGTLTVSGAVSYSWIPSGFTGSTFTDNPVANTVYTITGFASGCQATTTVAILVPPALTLNVSAGSPSACAGNSITLTAGAIGGVSAFTYSWNGGPLSATYPVTELSAGSYTYVVNAADANNCTIVDSISVTFFSSVVLSVPPVSVCPGITGTLSASGANTYTWLPQMVTGTTFTDAPITQTSYTINGTSAAGCIGQTTSSIFIKPVPSFSFATFSITCASLGSATISPMGGVGPFSYSWTPTAQTNSIAGGLYPGNYTVTVSDAGTGCALTPTTSFAALIPLTGTVSATNSILCYGLTTGTAAIQLSGGSNSQSYLWSDATSTVSTITASNLAAGIHTVNVVDALTFCSVTHTFFISQPPALTLTIMGTPSVCLDGSITFTGNASGGTPGYTYTWTTYPPGSAFSVTETSPGIYTYTASGTDANNCLVTKTVSATFVNNPVVSIPSVSICPLATGSLVASGASSYTWNTGYIGNPLFVSPLVTTTYTVLGSALGCTSAVSGSLILKPAPTATFTGNTSVCQGGSLQLSGLGSSLSYSWTGPLNFSSTSQNTTIASALPSQSGNYSLKVTALNSCTASITKSLTVHSTPTLSVSGSTVCQGKTLYLYASYLPGATYLWTGPANTSTMQNPVLTSSLPNMSGQYTTAITSIAGCSNIAVTQASVIALPVPVIITNTSCCVGSSLLFNGSGGSPLNWFGPNGFISVVPNPTLTNISPLAAGIYSLYAYNANCYASTTVTITVNPLPVPSPTNSSPVCQNSNFTLNSLSSAVSYTWAGLGNYNSNSSDPIVNFAMLNHNGIYTLSVTDTNNCVGTAITSVSVIPAPLPIVKNETVCLGGIITLTASGGVNYLWTGPLNYSSSFSFALIPQVNINNSGIYTVAVTGSNSCASSATVQLTVMPYSMPTPSISSVGKVCVNSKIDLQGSGGVTFFWSGPRSFTSTSKNASLIISDFNMGGTYTLSVSNESNCVASATILISVHPLPQAVFSGSHNNLCVPFCTEFKLQESQGSTPIVSYVYSVDQKTFTSIAQKHCFTQAGQHPVNISFKDTNNCINSSTLSVNAYPKPHADFQYSPLKPLAAIDKVLFYNSSVGDEFGTWSWFLSSTDSITSTDKDPAYLFEKAGVYPVVLLTKNEWGCSDTSIKVIEVYDDLSIYVPSAFTPNGDGLNDIFQPKGTGIMNYHMEIFSRWGENIFETADFSHGWDGTFKGEGCKTDIYVWRIYLTDISGKTKIYTGHVTLLRGKIKEEGD